MAWSRRDRIQSGSTGRRPGPPRPKWLGQRRLVHSAMAPWTPCPVGMRQCQPAEVVRKVSPTVARRFLPGNRDADVRLGADEVVEPLVKVSSRRPAGRLRQACYANSQLTRVRAGERVGYQWVI